MSINRVCISGNLTRDSELRGTQGGTIVLSFGVAVNERRKNSATGAWEDYPNFVDCTMFGARAEKLAQYLTKGCKVAIEGRLRYSSWTRDDERRSKLEVIVDEIEFLSRRDGQGAAVSHAAPPAPTYPGAATCAPQPSAPAQGVPAQMGGYVGEVYDEDIPF